jgi:hypothetical protein
MRLVLILLILLTGCVIPPSTTKSNYKLNASLTSNPGETMVSVETTEFAIKASGDYSTSGFRRELVYKGHTGTTLYLIYREYNEGSIRTAYTQELIYDLSEGTDIQAGPWQIRVVFAKNAYIEFSVLSDRGVSAAPPKPKPNTEGNPKGKGAK